jgi:sugar lactone lactonase YvrE/uncharacterized Zn finger protein (UPF0148 family)
MSLTFHCPSCGAPLDPPAHNEPSMRCPFCNSSVIVPQEMRHQTQRGDTLSRDQAMAALPDSSQQMIRIIRLIKDGEKEEAIRVFREAFDSNRSDAENKIEAIEQGQLVSLVLMRKEVRSLVQAAPVKVVQNRVRRLPLWLGFGCFVGVTLIAIFAGIFFALVPMDNVLAFFNINHKSSEHLTLITSFGSEGLMPGQFTKAESIAVDLQGNIYAADLKTGRIQQFDAQGNFLHLWDASDEDLVIWDLEMDQNGILYVAAERNILRFDTNSGETMESIPNPDNFWFYDLAILPDGDLVITANNTTLARINPDGSAQWIVEDAISTLTGESDTSAKLCVDGNNNVYLVGNFVHSVFKFSPDGTYLNRWGSEGEEPGQLGTVNSIAIDLMGQVVVSDWGGELEVFDSDGRFIEQIKPGTTLNDIVFDASGKLYAISGNEVLVYQIDTP